MNGSLQVGFAGIGRMGLPMARNLVAAGFPLSVYNRSAERCEPLRQAGAAVVATPAELGRGCDVIVTMLADCDAAAAVIDGPQGVLAGACGARSPVLVEMSTIGPDCARDLAARAAVQGVAMVDAPVSGSVSVAEAAELTAMVGGEQTAFERALPVLRAMTKAQFHLGESGAGAAMKLALNIMIASTTHALSEALVLAEGSGIDRGDAYDVVAASAVSSPFVSYKRAAFLDPEATPTAFALDLMRKDLALAQGLGEELGIPMLASAAAAEAMTLAAEIEGGEEDLAWVAGALRTVAAGGRAGGAGRP